MKILTDEQLMEQLQQGRTEALDELYRRYARRLYAFCANTMRSQTSHDPEDLVQDVFVRIIKSAHTYNPDKASFRTWMFRIARNRCIDVIRRSQRFQFLSLGHQGNQDETESQVALEEILTDQSESVIGAVVRGSNNEAVRGCIDELENEEEKQAILLYYLGDQVYREIGEILGKSTSMARNHVNAARNKVRQCLERKGIDARAWQT